MTFGFFCFFFFLLDSSHRQRWGGPARKVPSQELVTVTFMNASAGLQGKAGLPSLPDRGTWLAGLQGRQEDATCIVSTCRPGSSCCAHQPVSFRKDSPSVDFFGLMETACTASFQS